jgi:hypothetical protein
MENKMMRTNGKYKKVLNKNDEFDQLIMELAQKGVLHVGVVGIRQEPLVPETDNHPQKTDFLLFEKNHHFKRVKM